MPTNSETGPDRNHRLILPGIVVAGLCLRLIYADRSLFEDEFFSVYWVRQGIAYIWGPGLSIESNPPLYYTILWLWTKAFGYGEIALRLPAIMASIATIPIVYRIGRALFESRTALVAAALFAITPVQIGWSDQARSYGFQTLLSALCLLSIVLFVQSFLSNNEARRKALVLYFVSASLLAWTHYAQICFIAAGAVGVAALCLMYFRRTPSLLREWVLANGAVFLTVVAEIPFIHKVAANPGLQMIKLPLGDIPGNIAIMLSGTSYPVLAAIMAGLIGFCLYRIWTAPDDRSQERRLVLIVIPALYIGLLFAANFVHPVFVARVLVALAIPASLALAKLLTDIPNGSARAALTGGIAIAYAVSLPRDLQATPFRQVFGSMATRFRPGDTVVFGPYDRIGALAYYQPDIVAGGVGRWRPGSALPVTSEDRFWNAQFNVRELNTPVIQTLISQHRTVWLILLEDDKLLGPAERRLEPAPVEFADNPLLHVYLWQGSPP